MQIHESHHRSLNLLPMTYGLLLSLRTEPASDNYLSADWVTSVWHCGLW